MLFTKKFGFQFVLATKNDGCANFCGQVQNSPEVSTSWFSRDKRVKIEQKLQQQLILE